jgi:hypothetical protein
LVLTGLLSRDFGFPTLPNGTYNFPASRGTDAGQEFAGGLSRDGWGTGFQVLSCHGVGLAH